jgi:hypothetical protein
VSRVVDVAGIAVELHATDGTRQDAIDATCCLLVEIEESPILRISFGGDVDRVPEERFDLADGDVRAWWLDDTLVLAHGTFTATVRDAEARIGGEGNLSRAFRQLFPYIVTQLLAPHGRFVVHGGAIEHYGDATLVLGGTGSGKSTVVASALFAGSRALADDLVALRPGTNAPEVCGIAKPLTVDRDVADVTGIPSEVVDGDARGRCRLLVDLEPGWFPVRNTVVSGHGDTPSSVWQALGSGALTEWLLYSFLARHDARRRTQFLPIVAATVRRGGTELRHGTDGAQRIAAVAALLDEGSEKEPAT